MPASGSSPRLEYKDGILFLPACASITPPVTRIPDCAVINPTASTFVTSSYVRTPVNVAATPTKLRIVISGVPLNPAAVPEVF